MSKKIQVSTKPYKGTRDFFPEDMQLRNWFFNLMSRIVENYAYQKYDGPMLESFDLYAAKSGEELVNEQLYSFEDRGNRKVAIRPEMTPTLARMVAARGSSLNKPIRWYSLPNLWRYERPQKGRLREHWQLNVDILGCNELDAELEILMIAIDIMGHLGATEEQFGIQINNRKLTNYLFDQVLKLSPEQAHRVAKAIDKRDKVKPEVFTELLEKAECNSEQISTIQQFLESDFGQIRELVGANSGLEELDHLFTMLENLGLDTYCEFSPTIMRGLDYYTGTVFEIFDKAPDNRRALFGGGRYDNLVALFGGPAISGVGFGMGDVTLQNFLETHELIPELNSHTQVLIGLFAEEYKMAGYRLAHRLREKGFGVESILKPTKIGKQYQYADKKGIPIVVMIGPEEFEARQVKLKNLKTGEQETVSRTHIVDMLHHMLEKD